MKLHVKTGAAIARQVPGSVGIDLACKEHITLQPGFNRVELDVWLRWSEIRWQNFVMLLPRSSSFQKFGFTLANGTGIIDANYTGDGDRITGLLLNTAAHVTVIQPGKFFLQLVPVCQEPYDVIINDHSIWQVLPDRGGIGSTDK